MTTENTELADLRRDFGDRGLSRSDVAQDPVDQFSEWMRAAVDARITDPNAMTLSTADERGRPSARVVLLKFFGHEGFTFFTNYESKKGRDLIANPFAEFHFFWPDLDRQISISGGVKKTPHAESEAYFLSRPLESRIGAWASEQSREIADRETLVERVEDVRRRFDGDVPLPPFWGGFTMTPERFEFWQGRPSRLHDRIVYTRDGDTWNITRLNP